MSANINLVRQVKEDLLKEQAQPPGDGPSDRILDLLQRLDSSHVDLDVLAETLIGATVSKLKSYKGGEVGSAAKRLVKKWKALAKSQGVSSGGQNGDGNVKPAAQKKRPSSIGDAGGRASQQQIQRTAADDEAESEWKSLPTLRQNMCRKLRAIFLLSLPELTKEGSNSSAIRGLCVSRATEVEEALQARTNGVRQLYSEKARSLVFNLKKNAVLRGGVIMGHVSATKLAKMSSEELLSTEKAKVRNDQATAIQESRRLDWEEANEDKINDMCGIKGDLLNASLFTCGRCKSIKTTSTQKQTRSADEPMTVFVFCINCGNRWKC